MFNLYQLAETIKQRRKERGWTQKDLARAARVSRMFVARVETGNFTDIGFLKLTRILNVLGLTMEIVDASERNPLKSLYEKKAQRNSLNLP